MQLPPRPGRAPAAPSLPPLTTSPGVVSGEVLGDGRYAIGELLGSGGMAEVHRGRDELLDREVAIKLFRGQPDDGPSSEGGLSKRERSEAQLLAGLDHPGLVKVHDVGHSAGFGWVVMDLVDGPDLHQLLHDGPLALDRAWAVAHDVSRTLAYVHGRGITHRDVKPSNILTRDADPHSGRFGYVLTDFGIARRTDSARLTMAGQIIGTAAYFSPEQARGNPVDAATDVYALGLVLLECLTGNPAYEGHGLETALARLHHPPAMPATINPAWRRLIVRMTAMDAAERPTAAEVAEHLSVERDRMLTEGQTAALPNRPVPAPDKTRRAYVLGLPDEPGATSSEPVAAHSGAPIGPAPTVRSKDAGTPNFTAHSPDAAAAPRVGSHPDDSAHPAPRRGKRTAWVAGAVVVGLLLAILAVVLSGLLNPTPELEPLPAVPGAPGERLSELYESVQP